ncbi:MAG: O-methyltransferase [Myxococcales bacterium]|nr:O-methyltransferase [Myxococcales bacterium]
MMPIVQPDIEKYLATVRSPSVPPLAEMEAWAAAHDFPIVGPDVGRLLFILARFAGARRVLELGSGYGYSAFWFALALPPDGEVHCTDQSADNRDRARDYFRRAGMEGKLHFHVGEALSLARGIQGPFDIVFSDIDKEDYPAAIATATTLLRAGGLFVTDNALWYGKVAAPEPDAPTRGVLRFNQSLAADSRYETVILPLRDGLSVAVKK